MQKRVNIVDLVKSFQTSIYFQNLASIQPRTGLSKFAKNKPKVRKEVGKNIAPHNRERHDVLRYPEVLEAALRLRAPHLPGGDDHRPHRVLHLSQDVLR